MKIQSSLVPFAWVCLQILLGTCVTAQDTGSNNRTARATEKTYIVINNRAGSFFEAWRFCLALHMQLATITSADDSRLIEEAIRRSSNTRGPWWIAGTDLGLEGSFLWISTNSPVGRGTGYFNFSPGQPDNAGGNEDCLEIGRWGGVPWNDAACDGKQRFICEVGP